MPSHQLHRPQMPVAVALILILGASLRLPAVSAQEVVPVPNAGFEQGDKAPTSWTFSNGDDGTGRCELDTTRVHSGKRAVKLVKTNAPGYSMLTSDYIPVAPGRDYEVRTWVSVYGRSRGNVYFMISQYTADSPDMRLPNAFSVPRPIITGEGWSRLKVQVSIREGNTRLRIHCLVNQAPITVAWDDVEVGPTVIEKYVPRYEKPVAEVLPPLEPAEQRLAQRQRAVAVRKVIDGRARFVIDGKPREPAFYVGPFHNPQDAQIADFRNAGVRVYLMPLILGHGVYGDKGPWKGPGRYDFAEVDEVLWRTLRVDPDGYVIFYLATDPYRDWGAEHPTEICADQFGRKSVVVMHPKDWGREPGPGERYAPSIVSSVLRQETADAIRALVRHVNQSLPGKAVVGYHVAGLNDGQFFQWAGIGPDKQMHLADYSEASSRAFRDWVRRRYRNDLATLRAAWHRPDLTFDAVAIPSGERRLAPGFLLDAAKDQDIADYNRFYSEGTVETIHGYARVIKQETRGQVLVSTYWEDACANVDSHLATGKMLVSPDIDFLAGPAAYGVRMAGEVGECHSTWGSVGLHDRIYLTEEDWRSWLVPPSQPEQDHDVGRAETADAHNAMVRRECGMMLAFGQGTWWYDMGGGWFRDAGIMRAIAEARAAFGRDLAVGGQPRADMAVFISERSLDYLAQPAAGPYRYEGIVRQLFMLNQCGVPYHLYLQSDLPNPRLPEHKLYLFLNPQYVSPAEAAAMKALRRGGKTLAFVHALGVIGAADPAATITDLCGIKVRPLPGERRLTADIARTAGPLDPGDQLIAGGLVGPGFAVADERVFAVGQYPTGEVAVAARDFGTWRSVFCGPIGLSDSFLNKLAHWAGAWVAAEPGDAVYASQRFLTIHALWDGDKRLALAQPSRVVDLTTGQVVAVRATALSLSMRQGETRWFFLTPER